MRNIKPGLELIREFEDLKLKPYICPAGLPTIGIGTTIYPDGTPVTMRDKPITEDQAYQYLSHHVSKDVRNFERFLDEKNLTLNDNQFSAIISFAYNCGLSPVTSPGKSLYEALISKSNTKVVSSLMLYIRANVRGKRVVLNGLVRRRKAEAKLFCS